MKFTVNWLKEYGDIALSPTEIADRLTMLGLEVDAATPLGTGLADVTVGKILAVAKHPDADKLHLCQVDAGQGKTVSVVCGAPNVQAGMTVPLALAGSVLPGGLEIRAAKIRGELSAGMLCSEHDLGLSDDHKGLMELPDDIPSGSKLIDVLGLDDTLIEVDLTPNRADCTSVIGIAREICGVVGSTLREPVVGPMPILDATDIPFGVVVEDVANCPRYAARLLRNIKVQPSPLWLRNRLRAVGLRSINNVVDVTNYVMLEYGQPLHAFDFANLEGSGIVVRRPRSGETHFVTLDGNRRELTSDTLLICDTAKPVALAGIMGGENSEVTGTTTEVLLESACFHSVSIRRTAKRLRLGTDASYRFERGVDPELAPKALQRAVELLTAITGGEVVYGGADCREGVGARPVILLRVGRVNSLLGITLTDEQVAALLARIAITSTRHAAGVLLIQPPSFRVDLEREVDLIEEIARLVGYNEIPTVLPTTPMRFPEEGMDRRLRKKTAAIMTAAGFFEVINYSFTDPGNFDKLRLASDDSLRQVVRIKNPLAEDQGVMRTTLLPGLFENARRNINFQNVSFRLFETGKVFFPVTGAELPKEPLRLSGVLSGRRYPDAARLHYSDSLPTDILDVKGAIQLYFAQLGITGITFATDGIVPSYAEQDCFLTVWKNEQILGSLGKVHSLSLKAFGIKQDLYYFDIDLDLVIRLDRATKSFTPLPKFLPVNWDMAVIVAEGVNVGEILQTITGLNEPLIVGAEVFDVYTGNQIQSGSKSVAITITYRSPEQTLDDEIVGRVHSKVIDSILSRFHGQLREI